MKKSKFTESQIAFILRQAEEGTAIEDVCRKTGMAALGVRRGKAAFFSGCKSHPAIAPAGSNRSGHGGDEMAEAFGI